LKLKRILSLPFAVVADVVSLGNMGDRSFCQQVFDAERLEKREEAEREIVLALLRACCPR
jgi:hypothetical protein